jgi:DNA-binding transcriptional MerR regulator
MTNQDPTPTQMTIAEAAKALDVSEQTVRRRIKAGKLKADLIDGQYVVEIDTAAHLGSPNETHHTPSEVIALLQSQNAELKTQIVRLESQLDLLTAELSDSRQRSDSIIMQLSKTVESQQLQLQDQTLLIEDLRHPKSLWQRLFRGMPRRIQGEL